MEASYPTICRMTRKVHSAEEKLRIALKGLRGEASFAAFCQREGDPLQPALPPPTNHGASG